MATQQKTMENETAINDFINSFVVSEQKKIDSFRLIDLMREWSGFEPKMWGPSIIGFGKYHYKYASGHEGDTMLIGFSPRKAAFSLYVFAPENEKKLLLEQLGKFKMGKACIYINKLADINIEILKKLCKATIKHINENHECACKE